MRSEDSSLLRANCFETPVTPSAFFAPRRTMPQKLCEEIRVVVFLQASCRERRRRPRRVGPRPWGYAEPAAPREA